MAHQVLHQPRVAWDLARTLVSAAEADDELYIWFATRFGELLGADYRRLLFDTRGRLAQAARPDTHPTEVGLWRARLEDLLRHQPDLTEDLQILRLHAVFQLATR